MDAATFGRDGVINKRDIQGCRRIAFGQRPQLRFHYQALKMRQTTDKHLDTPPEIQDDFRVDAKAKLGPSQHCSMNIFLGTEDGEVSLLDANTLCIASKLRLRL